MEGRRGCCWKGVFCQESFSVADEISPFVLVVVVEAGVEAVGADVVVIVDAIVGLIAVPRRRVFWSRLLRGCRPFGAEFCVYSR